MAENLAETNSDYSSFHLDEVHLSLIETLEDKGDS